MSPLIRAAALLGYEKLARDLGLVPSTQFRRVGLSSEMLLQPDFLIPYPAMIALLERSARDAGRPDFGLQLSQRQGLDVLGPLAVITENAVDMAEAVALTGRYMFVHSAAVRLALRPAGDSGRWIDLCYDIDIVPRPACAQAIELALGVIVGSVHVLGQGEIKPHEILLPHARLPGGAAVHAQVLGAPCRFEQARAAVRYDARDMHRPFPRSNPMLRDMARSYIDTQFTKPGQLLGDRVRQLVQRLLGSGRTSHKEVAQMLAMHPRTMQRRLGVEGTNFESIKDEVRRSTAELMLHSATPPSLTMLVTMLDYADASTLTRSCHRWFGAPPRALRSAVEPGS